MSSIRAFNSALSYASGVPASTVDAYSRKLRNGGVFPPVSKVRNAQGLSAEHVAKGLLAFMRRSPGNSVDNATELGAMLPSCTRGFEGLTQAKWAALGIDEDYTLSSVLAKIILLYSENRQSDVLAYRQEYDRLNNIARPFQLTIDRYANFASIEFYPHPKFAEQYTKAVKSFHGGDKTSEALFDFPGFNMRGHFIGPMKIEFVSAEIQQVKKLKGSSDAAKIKEINAIINRRRAQNELYDLAGTETITNRTISTLGALFQSYEI